MADEQDVVNDAQNLQIERPHALRDPLVQEVQENIAHMLLRSWCCVLGQARDKHPQRRGQCEDGLSVDVLLLEWRGRG